MYLISLITVFSVIDHNLSEILHEDQQIESRDKNTERSLSLSKHVVGQASDKLRWVQLQLARNTCSDSDQSLKVECAAGFIPPDAIALDAKQETYVARIPEVRMHFLLTFHLDLTK